MAANTTVGVHRVINHPMWVIAGQRGERYRAIILSGIGAQSIDLKSHNSGIACR